MELTFQQRERLKRIQLDLFRQFLDICARIGLTYYLLGGTLLGAVRHQGFIPWDDDIDVGMPRRDYTRFLELSPRYLSEGIFLQTCWTDPEFPCNYAKLRNSRTTFIEPGLKHRDIHHGVYIDIFPLDFYPDKGRLFFDSKALLLKLRLTDGFLPGGMKPHAKLVRCLSRILYPSLSQAVVRREALFCSVKRGAFIANHCGAWGKKETVPAHWYGEGTVVRFEGLEVLAPSGYHAWLTQVYGDYMALPPPEQRISHHFIEFFDPDRPYTLYLGKEQT